MDKNTIGYKIRYYRKLSDLTQEQLANIVGIRRETISSYENNKTSPTLEDLMKIAESLKVEVDDLVIDYVKKENVNFENATEPILNVFDYITTMNAESLEACLDIIEYYKKFKDKKEK